MGSYAYIALFLFSLIATPLAHAERMYTWTDKEGETHISDAPPPLEYADKARARNVDAAPSRPEEVAPKLSNDNLGAQPRTDGDGDSSEKCGKDENQWRGEYKAIDSRRDSLETNLESLKAEYRSLNEEKVLVKKSKRKGVTTKYYYKPKDRIAASYSQLKTSYEQVQKDFNKLENNAADCVVPMLWRKQMHWIDTPSLDR